MHLAFHGVTITFKVKILITNESVYLSFYAAIIVDTIVSDERDKVEEMSHVKQALNMNGYPDILMNSIHSIQPCLETTSSILSDDTSDDGQETERDTTTKKPTCKKSPVVLHNMKGVSEQIRRVFKIYDVTANFKPVKTLSTATIENSCPSVCVCLSVCVCVCVHDNSKNNGSIDLKLEHIVVYENSSD